MFTVDQSVSKRACRSSPWKRYKHTQSPRVRNYNCVSMDVRMGESTCLPCDFGCRNIYTRLLTREHRGAGVPAHRCVCSREVILDEASVWQTSRTRIPRRVTGARHLFSAVIIACRNLTGGLARRWKSPLYNVASDSRARQAQFPRSRMQKNILETRRLEKCRKNCE